jgi:hypothetical protein
MLEVRPSALLPESLFDTAAGYSAGPASIAACSLQPICHFRDEFGRAIGHCVRSQRCSAW